MVAVFTGLRDELLKVQTRLLEMGWDNVRLKKLDVPGHHVVIYMHMDGFEAEQHVRRTTCYARQGLVCWKREGYSHEERNAAFVLEWAYAELVRVKAETRWTSFTHMTRDHTYSTIAALGRPVSWEEVKHLRQYDSTALFAGSDPAPSQLTINCSPTMPSVVIINANYRMVVGFQHDGPVFENCRGPFVAFFDRGRDRVERWANVYTPSGM